MIIIKGMTVNDSSRPELRKFVSPEIVFGEGALNLAGRYAKNLGAEKVLVVSDEGLVRAGWAGKVIESIEAEGLSYSLFSRVSPNPPAEEVMQGVQLYTREGCDLIVAVGGGSPTDCAKGIGVVSRNGGNILDYAGVDMIPLPGPPLICVPTTGSGADVSQFCIITDAGRRIKSVIVSKTLVPETSLIDPATFSTLPARQAAYTYFDSFSQAVEAYVSNASSPITDLLAARAAKLIYRYLLPALRGLEKGEHCGQLSLGSLEAGLAFTNASLGLSHAISHTLGGHTDMPHGLCNAMIFPYVVRFNYGAAQERYDKIGELMGLSLAGLGPGERKEAIVRAIRQFMDELGISMTLEQAGVKRTDIPELARRAVEDVCTVTNPRPATSDEIAAIFEEAL